MLDLSFDLAKSRIYRDKLMPLAPIIKDEESLTVLSKAPIVSFAIVLDQLESELKSAQYADTVGFIFEAMRSTLEEEPSEEVSKKLLGLLVELEEILDALIFWN